MFCSLVAVTEDGEVLQWGTGYSEDCTQPEPTLKGKNIIKVSLSRDRIMALSKSGEVYAMPISKKDQLSFKKPLEASSSWLPMGAVESPISYRIVSPKLTSWEKYVAFSPEITMVLTNFNYTGSLISIPV